MHQSTAMTFVSNDCQCYAQESLVPLPGENAGKPVCMMRDQLAEQYNFDNVDELTINEVEDYYAIQEIDNALINLHSAMVKNPLYALLEMDSNIHWKTVLEFSFTDGSAFLATPKLDHKYIPSILEFMSLLVDFKKYKKTDHLKDEPIYNSIPEQLIRFAAKSRIDSDYRLLACTAWHAFDSKISPMEDCTSKFIIDSYGNVSIQVSSDIPALMKPNVYQTKIASTSKNLLCCKCTCQCGSQESQRMACVHTFVHLYTMTMLLHYDLAEHILIELDARLNGCIQEV